MTTANSEEIRLGQIARILHLIENAPNRRTRPLPLDLPGQFDYWFDGGAYVGHTGTMTWCFSDGSQAGMAPSPQLSLWIRLPSGRTVWLREAEQPAPTHAGSL
jgi:hypothetical protein